MLMFLFDPSRITKGKQTKGRDILLIHQKTKLLYSHHLNCIYFSIEMFYLYVFQGIIWLFLHPTFYSNRNYKQFLNFTNFTGFPLVVLTFLLCHVAYFLTWPKPINTNHSPLWTSACNNNYRWNFRLLWKTVHSACHDLGPYEGQCFTSKGQKWEDKG